MRVVAVDPLVELKKFVEHYDLQREAATALGISQQFLSRMLRGREDISERVLEQLGLKRAVVKTK